MEKWNDRHPVYWIDTCFFGRYLGIYPCLRAVDGGEEKMNALYLITGLITLVLFVYLVIALLKPEWFE